MISEVSCRGLLRLKATVHRAYPDGKDRDGYGKSTGEN